MFNVDPGVYALGRFLSWMIFYYVFTSLYKRPKIYLTAILVVISLLADALLGNYSYLIAAILIYLLLWHKWKLNFLLINSILLTSLFRLISESIANTTIIIFHNNNLMTKSLVGSFIFVAMNTLIRLLIAVIFVYVYKHFNIENNWNVAKSKLLSLLLLYLFAVIYIFMYFIQKLQAYSDLIVSILLFILVQCIFIVLIFLKENQTQQIAYNRELTKEQLKNLKMYTNQLEKDQITLRDFEANYKGVIAGLRTVAKDGNYDEMQQSLSKLENYSDGYFDNISMQLFKDLNNVHNPYLKSLLISKLTLINQNKINCHFECRDAIDDIYINIFDLVRLLGISIDNAIEATKGQKDSEIQIAIVKEATQTSFLINNTKTDQTDLSTMMQEGYSTKQHHSGFGMVNVQDIKKKYPNLFVQYRQKDNWFNLSILIIESEGGKI